MKVDGHKITLEENDLKEIFGLFTSLTKHEKAQVYQQGKGHCLENEVLSEEYALTQEKRESALDAWRSVISFLHARHFRIMTESGEPSTSLSLRRNSSNSAARNRRSASHARDVLLGEALVAHL